MKEPRTVLLTGTSTGIGRAAALDLHTAGHTVIATARKRADIKDLADAGMTTLALDVSKEASMAKGVADAVAAHDGIDVLVNNAGFGSMLPQEEMPMETMRAMFEVNVFGLQRMTQLALPHLRANEDRPGFGRGRIVNVGSSAGLVSLPLMGQYCATKFAVRALTWSLNGEVNRFGVKASLIEPGAIRTEFGARSVAESSAPEAPDGPYATLRRNWDAMRFIGKGAPVSVISKRIVHAATARRPKFHYVAPMDARGARFASRFLPDPATQALASSYMWRNDGE